MAATHPQIETRELVAKMQNDQGLHECEVFGCGSEKDEGWLAWEKCEKNPGHKNFIPVLEFSNCHLPFSTHKTKVLNLIKVIAELTVRLQVGHVSVSRPEGYAFAKFRGKNIPFTGTGWVYEVVPGEGACPCLQCSGSSSSEEPWWKIVVFTACHVIYDKNEAEKTKVDLFYDEEKSQVKTVHGYSVEDNNQNDDVCLLQCTSHDAELAETLMACIERYERLNLEIPESAMPRLCVVVSHPHGQPKKVTVGNIYNMVISDPEASFLTNFMRTYTGATCKGSSGAPIICAVSKKVQGTKGVWPGAGPHSMGQVEEGRQLNQCGPGIFYIGANMNERMEFGRQQEKTLEEIMRSERRRQQNKQAARHFREKRKLMYEAQISGGSEASTSQPNETHSIPKRLCAETVQLGQKNLFKISLSKLRKEVLDHHRRQLQSCQVRGSDGA